jgi:beta-lactamase superfamily II metal-dependent hydrolase
MRALLLVALLLFSSTLLTAQSKTLDIYWIDVEGGAATLIVAPSGQSMLIDTGYETGGRDAKRIYAATQQAGLKSIDHMVISHYHGDHVGGLAALSKMIPIGRFYGPNDVIEPQNQKWFDSYRAAAAGKRTIAKPGDMIPLQGVQAMVVSADRELLSKPLPGGGPNPLCANAEQKAPAGLENERMVGIMLTYGRFKFLDLTDLDWATEMRLVCPENKLGKVTVHQTDRHGSWEGAGAPAFLGAIAPQVIVFNNGPRKGLGQMQEAKSTTPEGTRVAPYERNGYARAAKLPGIEGIWQGHLSLLDKDPAHNTSPDMIANLGETAECAGHWIKASVESSGRFTITNSRNGFSKTYTAR